MLRVVNFATRSSTPTWSTRPDLVEEPRVGRDGHGGEASRNYRPEAPRKTIEKRRARGGHAAP